jgi:lysophospholipase
LIFPGRTEFVEKYGMTAKALQAHGLTSVAIDWRGQGIADRMLPNRGIGHVGVFEDYQKDVAALMDYAQAMELPRPYYLLAHSMGGCIGLRSLNEGLDVAAVMFSAPMWGVTMSPPLRPAAWMMSGLSMKLGLDTNIVPGQLPESYVLREEFANNTLTNDPQIWQQLRAQLETHPDLGLGGPSLRWLYLSLQEMRHLSGLPSPKTPCLTYLGTKEAIVDPQRIRDRMAKWQNGKLRIIEGGQHEMLMDVPEMRNTLTEETAAFFAANN